MPTYHYQALDAHQQVITGEVQAEGVQQAIEQLEAIGLSVQSIADAAFEQSRPSDATEDKNPADGAPHVSETLVTDSLGVAVQSHLDRALEQGRRIVPALEAYSREPIPRRRRRELRQVCRVLERGDQSEASEALTALPQYWIPLLSATAATGDAGGVLRAFLEESQRAEQLRWQWRRAFAYPMVIGAVAIGILAALSYWIVPVFREMFSDFGLQLPWITLAVLSVADWITSAAGLASIALLALVLVLLFGGDYLLPRSAHAWFGDRFGLPVRRSTSIAQLTRSTAELLEAGVDLPNALRLAGMALNRPRVRDASVRLADAIENRGGAGGAPMYARPLTNAVLYALQAQIAPTSRIRLLKEISCCYADRAQSRLSWTYGFVEPMAICVIGVVIGSVVVGLFLPLVSLVNNLSG